MYKVGIDLGGTNIAIGIVDENNTIVLKDKVPTRAEREANEIVADMAALCKSLIERIGTTVDNIEFCGIASPGTVDPVNCTVKYANNIKMFNYPIGKELCSLVPFKKIGIQNDANAAAWGEHLAGAAVGTDNSIMITLGTGLGGGVVLEGKIYSGYNYAGAEFGHMVVEYDGLPCTCGRLGCWEAYASATGLITLTRLAMEKTKETVMWDIAGGDLSHISGRTAFNAMRQGDSLGKAVVDKYIRYLACGITNLINIFQPQIFSIGGGVSNEKDYLLLPLLDIVDRDQYGTRAHEDKTELKIAKLGNDAGIIGAALLGKADA